jgi:hypothetical protein
MDEHATHLVNFRWIIQQFSCSEFSCLWIMVWLQAWPREYQLTTNSSQNFIVFESHFQNFEIPL